jgi:hypothetical protein
MHADACRLRYDPCPVFGKHLNMNRALAIHAPPVIVRRVGRNYAPAGVIPYKSVSFAPLNKNSNIIVVKMIVVS